MHYRSYISGQCAAGNNAIECAKRNVEECRKCRQENAAKEKPNE
jgi:hypothetical protein